MTENASLNPESSDSQENSTWEFIKVILQALVLAIIVRTLIFQPFSIPSGSMMPNLSGGGLSFRQQIQLRIFTLLSQFQF